MFRYELRDSFETALEFRKKVAKTIDVVDPKARRRIIWTFVLLAIAMAMDPIMMLFTNITLAEALGDAHAESEYVRMAIWLSAALIILPVVGVALVPILAKYLFIVFGYLYLPLDMAVRYIFSRQKGYQESRKSYEKFLEPNQIAPFQIVVWYIMSIWILPGPLLWPAKELGLSPITYMSLSIYLVGLIGCGLLWFRLNKVLDHELDQKTKAGLAGWLGNPAGLKNFMDLPLLMVACLLFFGFLVWPALDFTLREIKQGAAAFFVQDLDYEGSVGISRQRLLWMLESQEGDVDHLKELVLPPTDEIAEAFAFRFPEFRSWRDQTLVHLIPLWALLTAAVMGIRKLLYLRAAPLSGPGKGLGATSGSIRGRPADR